MKRQLAQLQAACDRLVNNVYLELPSSIERNFGPFCRDYRFTGYQSVDQLERKAKRQSSKLPLAKRMKREAKQRAALLANCHGPDICRTMETSISTQERELLVNVGYLRLAKLAKINLADLADEE